MSEKIGYVNKYKIEKADGSPVDPHAVYFVLRIDTDLHAQHALYTYIEECWEENSRLGYDLWHLLKQQTGWSAIECPACSGLGILGCFDADDGDPEWDVPCPVCQEHRP